MRPLFHISLLYAGFLSSFTVKHSLETYAWKKKCGLCQTRIVGYTIQKCSHRSLSFHEYPCLPPNIFLTDIIKMCTEREEVEAFAHQVYKNDPLLFKNYIGKHVNVTTEDNNVCSGTVYTVDPVSESIVLLEREESKLRIVLGHAIKSIEVVSEATEKIAELFLIPTNIPHSVLSERRDNVKRLLQENRFPVVEQNDDLLIEDTVLIQPPYDPENCICSNSIILDRIQSLLARIK